MYAQSSKTRVVNRSLTNTIISLHGRGYTEDFVAFNKDGKIAVLQGDGGEIAITDFQISVINQFFDRLSLTFTYLHAIETNCGLKGIMLSNSVLFTNRSQCVQMESMYYRMVPYGKNTFTYQQAI
ncbi:MAG: hypothetical protein M3O71_09710 [Bacteroidota bacterium]|nr:hypothetical protein [Bacteroidota bacterium]